MRLILRMNQFDCDVRTGPGNKSPRVGLIPSAPRNPGTKRKKKRQREGKERKASTDDAFGDATKKLFFFSFFKSTSFSTLFKGGNQ